MCLCGKFDSVFRQTEILVCFPQIEILQLASDNSAGELGAQPLRSIIAQNPSRCGHVAYNTSVSKNDDVLVFTAPFVFTCPKWLALAFWKKH